MKEDFYLVGHLQVMDEPLSSLYVDHANGRYYIFVRLYVNAIKPTYLVSEVSLIMVQRYMKQEIGLTDIFSCSQAYLFTASDKSEFSLSMLVPLGKDKALNLLKDDGVEDLFDKYFSYKYVALKNYINECLTKTTLIA